MQNLRGFVFGGLALLGVFAAMRAMGPALHPCTRLERSLCAELGPADCARWRERGQPGLPPPRAAFQGRGRRASGDAALALLLAWDPSLPSQSCSALSRAPAREALRRNLARTLQ